MSRKKKFRTFDLIFIVWTVVIVLCITGCQYRFDYPDKAALDVSLLNGDDVRISWAQRGKSDEYAEYRICSSPEKDGEYTEIGKVPISKNDFTGKAESECTWYKVCPAKDDDIADNDIEVPMIWLSSNITDVKRVGDKWLATADVTYKCKKTDLWFALGLPHEQREGDEKYDLGVELWSDGEEAELVDGAITDKDGKTLLNQVKLPRCDGEKSRTEKLYFLIKGKALKKYDPENAGIEICALNLDFEKNAKEALFTVNIRKNAEDFFCAASSDE